MKSSYSWGFYRILLSRSLCGRAFSSWIVLEDIVLTDESIHKKFVGFTSLVGFPKGEIFVYFCFVVLVFLSVILLHMVIVI